MSSTKTNLSLSEISIIVALGNPGAGYANTYHNAGVQFIRFIKENCFTTPLRQAQDKPFGFTQDKPTIVESLGTFMNVSGPAVNKLLKKNGISPDHLLLVHDDVDLPIGTFKFSFGSGAAGHHGVESVIASLGTKDFWRLRIGIAKTITTPDGTLIKKKADTYVLKPISQTDSGQMQPAFERAMEQLQK